jgi:hypothetical protein
MGVRLAIPALCALALLVSIVPALADDTTTCATIGPSMVDLQQNVNDAVLAATEANRAATHLPGTTPSPTNPFVKTIEEKAALAQTKADAALRNLGPLLGTDIADPAVQQATDAVTAEARTELQTALGISELSQVYAETGIANNNAAKAVSAANARARRAAFFQALSQSFARNYSTTQGTINGQPFTATTVTTPGVRSIRASQIQMPPPDATMAQMRIALAADIAEMELLPYTFNPLVQHWIVACRAAHQLPPAAQTQ